MKIKFQKYSVLLAFTLLIPRAFPAYIQYNGETQNANLTTHPWVLGSTMWGSIESGKGTGSDFGGLTSLAGKNISQFTFTFGDLELTDFLSPTSTDPGFELYTEGDASTQPIEFFYDGDLWASGVLNFIRIEVQNSDDLKAVGEASAQLNTGGVDSTFFDEVMSLTGGELSFLIADFLPVDAAGKFSSVGTINFPSASVPESHSSFTFLALAGGCFFLFRVRAKNNFRFWREHH